MSLCTCVIVSKRVELLGHAEVGDFERVVEGDQQVAGLDVVVDDALSVQILEAVNELDEVFVGLVERKFRERGRREHLLDDAHAVLHHQVHLGLLLVVQHIDELDDVPVFEGAQEENLVAYVQLTVWYPSQLPLRQDLKCKQRSAVR